MSEMPNRYNHHDPDAVAERKVDDAQFAYLRMASQRALLTKEEESELNQRMWDGKDAQSLIDAGQNIQGLFTGQETHELFAQVAMGQEARAHIIEANLRLAYKVAKENYRREYKMDSLDLASCAVEGLIKAVDGFDHRKAKLSTYATAAIENLIPRVVAKEGRIICVSEDVGRQMKKYDAVKSKLAGAVMDNEPTDEDYAAATGFPLEKTVLFRTIEEQRPMSYDQPVGVGEVPLIDIIAVKYQDTILVEQEVLENEKDRLFESLFSVLNKHEEELVRRYFGIGYKKMSYVEIGKIVALPRELVSSIVNDALKKLKTYLDDNPEHADALKEQFV